jgi:hypothetical protein
VDFGLIGDTRNSNEETATREIGKSLDLQSKQRTTSNFDMKISDL